MAPHSRSIAPASLLLLAPGFVILALILVINTASVRPALGQLLDFGSFVASGRQAAVGDNPYASDAPLVYRLVSKETGQVVASPNLNPPLSVVIFRRVAGLNPLAAASGWRLISVILFGLGLLALGWHYRARITPLRLAWAFCLAGIWNTIALGQIYAPIFLLTTGTWILMDRYQGTIAGILLGAILAIKPNFILWLLLLGLAGYTVTVLSALVTLLVLSLLPVLTLGPQVYLQWIRALLDYPSLGLTIAGNSSLASLAARTGHEDIGLILSLALAVSAAYFVARYRKTLGANDINTLGIIGSILASPFSWAGYTVLTLPIFFARGRWNAADRLAAACLVFPYVLILSLFPGSLFSSILFGWLYGWGLLLLLGGVAAQYRAHRARPIAELPS